MKREKTILQTTMGLDIGGAETHIVELSIELKKRGYRVIVVSNGGVYEDILKDYGVEIQHAPMHTRRIGEMAQSLKTLRRIIRREEVDLVHSHARIPSFLLSILKKFMDFNIVTTAHGTFQVNRVLKAMTYWGEEVVAVSKDIEKYLLENYDIDESKISLNINGINLNRFKSKSDYRGEIVHISRLEPDTSEVAYALVEYGRQNLNERIVIVGDGSELKSLKKRAEGAQNIELVGKTSNVERYLDRAKLFIGISRAALEAMCYNVPVILAGNYGYSGVLEKGKLIESEYSNFTARNCESFNKEKLYYDMDKILLDLEKKDFSWYRGYIEENYSVEKMVDNYEKIYKKYLED